LCFGARAKNTAKIIKHITMNKEESRANLEYYRGGCAATSLTNN